MVSDPQGKTKIVVAAIGDVLLALAAYFLCFYVRSVTTFPLGADLMPLNRFQHLPHYWAALLISQVVWLYFLGFYDQVWDHSLGEIIYSAAGGVAVQTLFLGMVYGLASQAIFPRTIFPLFWLFNSALVSLWRALLMAMFRARGVRRVLIVGVNPAAARLIKILETQKNLGLEVIGLLSEDPRGELPEADAVEGGSAALPAEFCGRPILGSVQDLDGCLQKYKPDEVILSSGMGWQDLLIDALGRGSRTGVRLSLLPNIYEILIGKPRHLKIRDVPLIEVASNPNPSSRLFIKRLLDVFFSSLLLLPLLPVLILVALYVRLSSSGPVLYSQERTGKDGSTFHVHKFRTMVPDAEKESGAVLSVEADPRITKAGRFLRRTRLDELPQLFNVLKGEMSFIGPRPERPVFVAEFEKKVPGYSQRHAVKPGITGLAQVNGYYDTDADNKLKYDLYYIHNYSLWLDFLIVVETLKTMIARKGL